MKINKKNFIKILCLLVIVVSSVLLVIFTNNGKDNNEPSIKEETSDNQSILSDDVINDLKNNLGKGKNGDVVNIDQGVNEKGEAQYTFTYNDGTTQIITIKDKEGGSGVEDIDPGSQEAEDPQEEDPSEEPEDNPQEEPSEEPVQPQEDPGTVYERYINMSKREQYAFYKSFNSQAEFVEWYKAAQEEYAKLHPQIVIGQDQAIDFGN